MCYKVSLTSESSGSRVYCVRRGFGTSASLSLAVLGCHTVDLEVSRLFIPLPWASISSSVNNGDDSDDKCHDK